MRDKILSLPGDPRTSEGKVDLLEFVRAMSATHGATLERLLTTHADAALLSQVLEDIGNRYIDLSELLGCGGVNVCGEGGRHLALNY